jgi:NAD(P) transhydrogenase
MAPVIAAGHCRTTPPGQAVMTYGGTIDCFIHSVFNDPTLAEADKLAACDGVHTL